MLLEYRMYEKVKRHECLTSEEFFHMTPNRDEFAALYRFLEAAMVGSIIFCYCWNICKFPI